jgi:hypothetical protein
MLLLHYRSSVPSSARAAEGVHASTGDGALACIRNDAVAAAATPQSCNHCRCSRLRAQGVTDRQHILL